MDNFQEVMVEGSPEKSLTLEEEEKLKEKLALLKKEYKRTFNRLQRSQTLVKKTIDEQNRSLSQAATASASPEPLRTAADSIGNVRELQPSFQTAMEEGDRRLSFTSNVESELLRLGSPQCPNGQENGLIEQSQETSQYDQGQSLRSRLKLKRSRRRECWSSPTNFPVPTNTLTLLDRSEQDVSTLCASGSPLLKRSINVLVGDAQFCQNECDDRQSFSLGMNQENTSSKDFAEDHNSIQQKDAACSSINSSVSRTCGADASILGTPQICKNKPIDGMSRESSVAKPPSNSNEGQGQPNMTEENNPLSSCTLVEGLLFPVEYYVRTTRRMSNCQRKVDLNAVINSQLGRGRRGTRGRGKQEKVSGDIDNTFQLLSPKGFLASGSVSSTASPIPHGHSTEGKSRGARQCRRGKGRGGSPAANTLLSEMSPGAKEVSIQLEFSNLASPPTSGSQSEKENCESQSQSQIDPSDVLGCPIGGAGKSRSNERINSQESHILRSLSGRNGYMLRPRNSTSFCGDTQKDDFERDLFNHITLKQDSECSGSLFPSLSNRLSLKHLSSCSDIRDFHLPDEEFGDLKLKKLKTASHFESSVPEQFKNKRHVRSGGKKSTAAPPAGSSTILQEANAVCPDDSKPGLGLLKTSEDNLRVMESVASQNALASSASPKHDPVLTQLHAAPECPNALTHGLATQLTPGQVLPPEVCENVREQDFPLNQPCKQDKGHGVNYSRVCEGVGAVSLKPTTATQMSEGPLVLDKSDAYLSAVNGLETHEPPQSKNKPPVEILPVDPVDVSLSEMNSHLSENLTCNVLLSTSMCSVPLETFEVTEVATCTPGFPLLGSTPAIPPTSPCRGSPLKCHTPKFHTDAAVSSQALPVGVTGDEQASVRSDGKHLTLCNGTAKLSGAEPRECVKTKHKEACNTRHPGGKQTVGYPVSNIDGNSSQVAAASGPVHAKIEERTSKGGRLHLVSQIQDGCGGRCAVDLCSTWWEFPDSRDLCIVAASESSVSLWRPHSKDQWEVAHTWYFTEMPVLQILPLPGENNIVCVALGNLEIGEIWSLLSCPESLAWEQRKVKCDHAKIAQGLTRHRIVSSSGLGSSQVVEVLQLSAKGSIVGSHKLMSPQDSVLAFCEVDGERSALVGCTVNDKVVIWNSVSGQLLRTIYVGDLCRDSACLSASSDSGLLFLVLASLYNSNQKTSRKCIFRLIAVNPKGACCANVMHYELPEDHSGRFLEGDVKHQRAAAVLSCGSIALWDLSSSQRSAVLPPALDSPWSLVRWDHSSSSILAGQKDGNICIYMYSCTGLNPTQRRESRVHDLGETLIGGNF